MLDKKPRLSFKNSKFYSSLEDRDLSNLKFVFSLNREDFSIFYEGLSEEEKQYLDALIYTHRFDVIDHVFDKTYEIDPEVTDLLSKIKDNSNG